MGGVGWVLKGGREDGRKVEEICFRSGAMGEYESVSHFKVYFVSKASGELI